MKRAVAVVTLTLAASLLAGCFGGSRQATPPAPSPDSDTVTPTATPTAGATATSSPAAASTFDVNGRSVPVHPARIEEPLTAPRSLSILVTHGCWSCDEPDKAIERVSWDSKGTVRTETLFSAGEMGGSYITGIGATPDGSVLVVGVCVRAYCGPMGSEFNADARVTVLRSLDGGVSWAELATVSGYAFPLGVASDGQAIVLRRDSATSAYVAKLPSGDRFPTPPAAASSDWPQVFGDQPYWNPDRGSTLVSPERSWPLDIPAGSSAPRVIVWGRGYPLYQWFDRRQGPGVKSYVGDPHEDGVLGIAWEVPQIDLEIRTWPHSTSLLGDASFDGKRLPVLIHLGQDPTELTIQPVDAPVFPPNDRNKVVAGLVGTHVRVSGAGDCLNVRSAPSISASQLGCFKDGVLLPDLGETTTVEGRTWVKVMTPTPPDDWVGKQGWAAAEFLER